MRSRHGVTAVEYGLIITMVSVAIVSVLPNIGQQLQATFTLLAMAI